MTGSLDLDRMKRDAAAETGLSVDQFERIVEDADRLLRDSGLDPAAASTASVALARCAADLAFAFGTGVGVALTALAYVLDVPDGPSGVESHEVVESGPMPEPRRILR